jgi:hypothetical protein
MCKVAAIAKVSDTNRKAAWELMRLLGGIISEYNDDGLGYASFDKAGNLFGERWLINKTAFTDLEQLKGMNAQKLGMIYNSFGEVKRDEAQGIIFHTRAATCGKGIKNTHPFINDINKPEIAIIHNGVIANHELLTKKYSTCDSETIVHLYEQYNVADDYTKLATLVQRLLGWFTVLTLAKDKTGRMVMDIFTDGQRLSSYYIPELDTRVYSTSPRDIVLATSALGMSVRDGESFYSNTARRLDLLTGTVIESSKLPTNFVHTGGMFDDDTSLVTYYFRR